METAQSLLFAGEPLENATAAMVMIHGRGATARDILSFVPLLNRPELAYLAPQAPGNTWYPLPFMAPLRDNEPYLSSSLGIVSAIMSHLSDAGILPERTILFGFSQGACLALEYAARNARRYGAVVGLSGGLIGPDDLPRDYEGSFEGTPVFLGCSDRDPHIPSYRVKDAAEVFRRMGGDVTERLYPNMGHTVNEDEINFVQDLLSAITSS